MHHERQKKLTSTLETASNLPEAGGKSAIGLVKLTKRFNEDVLAVDDFSLEVEKGMVFGLLGPNGAGKTTALRMLLGLIHPTKGEAYIFGQRIYSGHPVL